MSDFTSELGPDGLFLRGRLQVEVARDALNTAGINPNAEAALTRALFFHDMLLPDSEEQEDLELYLEDEDELQIKKDVLASLQLVIQDTSTSSDAVLAAEALIEILQAPPALQDN